MIKRGASHLMRQPSVGFRSTLRRDRHLNAIRIKRQILFNRGDRRIGVLVRPHNVLRTLPANGNAVVRCLPFVRSIRGVSCTLQERRVDIPSGNVLNRRQVRFVHRKSALRIGNCSPAKTHSDALPGRRQRDRMIGSGNLWSLLRSHDASWTSRGRKRVSAPVSQAKSSGVY